MTIYMIRNVWQDVDNYRRTELTADFGYFTSEEVVADEVARLNGKSMYEYYDYEEVEPAERNPLPEVVEVEWEYGLEDLTTFEETVKVHGDQAHAEMISLRFDPPREVRRRQITSWEKVEA